MTKWLLPESCAATNSITFSERCSNSGQDVSDLIFTVDKPLQVEAEGELMPVPLNPPIEKLTPFQTEMIALNLIGGNPRLARRFAAHWFLRHVLLASWTKRASA